MIPRLPDPLVLLLAELKGHHAMAAPAPEYFAFHRRLWLAAAVVAALAGLAVASRMALQPRELAVWLAARRAFVSWDPATSAAAYFAFYVVFAALSLPGAWMVSLAGGALFGLWLGIPLIAISSTSGATAAMLAARYLFRDAVAARFPGFVERVDRGVSRDGARWLFAARLTPIIPFFAINLAVGLTRMPAMVFGMITLVGVIPLSLLFGLAGGQLARIESPEDLLNPPVLAALFALAAAPFAAKGLGQWRAARRDLPAFRDRSAPTAPR